MTFQFRGYCRTGILSQGDFVVRRFCLRGFHRSGILSSGYFHRYFVAGILVSGILTWYPAIVACTFARMNSLILLWEARDMISWKSLTSTWKKSYACPIRRLFGWLSWTSIWEVQLNVRLDGPTGHSLRRANGYINAGNVGRIISRFVQLKCITTLGYLYILNPTNSWYYIIKLNHVKKKL